MQYFLPDYVAAFTVSIFYSSSCVGVETVKKVQLKDCRALNDERERVGHPLYPLIVQNIKFFLFKKRWHECVTITFYALIGSTALGQSLSVLSKVYRKPLKWGQAIHQKGLPQDSWGKDNGVWGSRSGLWLRVAQRYACMNRPLLKWPELFLDVKIHEALRWVFHLTPWHRTTVLKSSLRVWMGMGLWKHENRNFPAVSKSW